MSIERLQQYIEKDRDARRVMVALQPEPIDLSFGWKESDLQKMTGLDSPKIREILGFLDRNELLQIKCTQVGTAGPYDLFFRLKPGIKVTINVTSQ